MCGLRLLKTRIYLLGKICFEVFPHVPAAEHDTMFAGGTFQTNICAEADDFPLVSTARMRLSHPQHVLKFQVGQHTADYNTRML